MSKAREERIKLRANYFNGLAIALAAIGGVAPVVATVLRPEAVAWRSAVLALICLATSYAIHLVSRRTLKGLDE